MYALFHMQVNFKRCCIYHSAVADVNVMCDYEHNGVWLKVLYYR